MIEKELKIRDNYLFLVSWKDELYNYCPYCGAKMDSERND